MRSPILVVSTFPTSYTCSRSLLSDAVCWALSDGASLECGRGWVVKKGWNEIDPLDPRTTVDLSIYATAFSDIFLRAVDAETITEKIFLVVAEVVIGVFFGSVAAYIFTMISAMKMTAENYDRKMTELREFGHQRKLPKSLQMRLMSYNKFLYQNGTVFDAKAILGELPLHMRRDVVYGIYGDLIKESYFFLGIQHNDSAVMRICMELKETAALLGDEIFREGDIGDDMYFLLEGQVLLTTEALDMDSGLQHEASLKRQDSDTSRKPFSQLLLRFEYGYEHGGLETDEVFRSFLGEKVRRGDCAFACTRRVSDGGALAQEQEELDQNKRFFSSFRSECVSLVPFRSPLRSVTCPFLPRAGWTRAADFSTRRKAGRSRLRCRTSNASR